jgi:fatty acid desaturase
VDPRYTRPRRDLLRRLLLVAIPSPEGALMSAQVVVSFLRWLAIGVLVGGGAAIAAIVGGDPWQKAALKGLATAVPIWLGALGWGGYDGHRAAVAEAQTLAAEPITAVRPYDVGYHLLHEYDRLALDYAQLCLEHQDLKARVGSP